MKRYSIYPSGGNYSCWTEVEEDPEGDWVKHEDVEAMLEKLSKDTDSEKKGSDPNNTGVDSLERQASTRAEVIGGGRDT